MTVSLQLFTWIISIFLGVLISLVGFIVAYILKNQSNIAKTATVDLANLKIELHVWKVDIERSVSSVKKEQDEIKFNYLKRFESVNANIHAVKEEIIEKIHDLHTSIIENKS